MNSFTENFPSIISAAAQSHLGILALIIIALTILAFFFFTGASEKVRVGIFLLLSFGAIGFGAAMFRSTPLVAKTDKVASNEKSQKNALLAEPATVKYEQSSLSINASKSGGSEKNRTKDSLVEKELYDKNLFKKLQDAGTRLGPENDAEAILRLYRDVLFQLSPEARGRLDQVLLISSDNEYQAGRNLSAVGKYKQLFNDYH